MHEVVGDEPGKRQQTLHAILQTVGHAQQQEGDQRDSDLNAYSVL